MLSMEQWHKLLASGDVSHVRPRRSSGSLTLNAYDTSRRLPLLGAGVCWILCKRVFV